MYVDNLSNSFFFFKVGLFRKANFLIFRLTSDVVDGLLVFLHAGQVLCEGGGLISRLGAVVAQQLRQLLAVLRVLVDAQLQTDNEL